MHWGIDSENKLLSPQLFLNRENAPMPTECSATLFKFPPLEGRQVVASFDGGAITSDAGALLLGQTDRALRLTERFAACFADTRTVELVEHQVETMVIGDISTSSADTTSPCPKPSATASSASWALRSATRT
jgi:hypothetical protein